MKHSPEDKQRVLELHKLINLHSHNYHSLDEPKIEDHEYDSLFNELLFDSPGVLMATWRL